MTWPDGADPDTDVIPDTDTETDSCDDTDVDTAAVDHDPPECPLNSGWPCSCDVPDGELFYGECEDGSWCVQRNPCDEWDWPFGACSPFCMAEQDDTCPGETFSGEPDCIMLAMSTWGCLLQCVDEGDCPPDQSCVALPYGQDETHWCFPFP